MSNVNNTTIDAEAVEVPIDETQTLPRLLAPAGFWLRAIALWLDGLIIGLATSLLAAFGIWPAGVLVGWLYYAFMESGSWQATLGKRAVGIIVVTEAYETISFTRASGRYFGKFISALIFNVGFLMAAFTERKQALHDLMAKTLVVKVR